MDFGLTALVGTVVGSFLIPFIKKGAHKLVETVGEKLGDSAADESAGVAARIWKRVKSAFSSQSDQAVFAQFAEHPDAARGLIEAMLTEKLKQNPSLATDLHELVEKAKSLDISTGAEVHAGGNVGIADARHADFSHSTGARIIGANFETPEKKPEDGPAAAQWWKASKNKPD